MKPLYIMLHIHKCAGSTLRHHVISNLDKSQYLLFRKRTDPSFEDRDKINLFLSSLRKEQKTKINFITGHGAYYGIHKYFEDRDIKYYVFLRNPFERIVSNYNFFVQNISDGHRSRKIVLDADGNIMSFRNFIEDIDPMKNYMTRFLYKNFFDEEIIGVVKQNHLTKVTSILEKFYFVGLTENLDDQLYFYSLLNVSAFYENRNESKKIYTTQNGDIEIFNHYNKIDLLLYKYALKLNKKRRENNKNYYKNVNTYKSIRDSSQLLKNYYN